MSWIDKILPHKIRTEGQVSQKSDIPEGVWSQCPSCQAALYQAELEKNLMVCPKCQHHLRVDARLRLKLLFDEHSRTQEIGADVKPIDALNFKDTKSYKERLAQAQKKMGEPDAMVVLEGEVLGKPLVASAFEFGFLGGSMGSVVGEKFVRGANRALEKKIPYVCFTSSGGARMQESLLSLMQMAKVSAVIARMKQLGIPYIVVLTDPTTGGVSASLAMLGDLHFAEPEALIGFAGPRVIEQTVREKLPKGFQRSEFLVEKGMVDMIVHRKDLRVTLRRVLDKFGF